MAKIAEVVDGAGSDEALRWWRDAYEIFNGMKEQDMFIPAGDEGVLQALRVRLGK